MQLAGASVRISETTVDQSLLQDEGESTTQLLRLLRGAATIAAPVQRNCAFTQVQQRKVYV